ncbi:MAG: DUF4330 family protein [Haloferacaceae archaeon]
MELIDEQGRLFGRVNVVDALVVLVVLAVVVAGAALVLSDDPEPEPDVETTYATLDLGTQPAYVVDAINEGDAYSPGSDSRLAITDVHLTPQDGQQRVILRVELRGVVDGGSLQYDGAPPRLGRTLGIVTDRYEVEGQVRQVGDGDALAREETTVVLRDTLDAADAREVAPGDEIRLAGRTVATVEDVAAYAGDSPTERVVLVEATLDAHRQGGDLRFGGTPVRRGQSVRLPADGYALDGRIERVGGGLERGSRRVVLRDTVGATEARALAAGDEVAVAGHSVATIEDVAVYRTGNPDAREVYLEANLTSLEYGERPAFGGAPLQEGRTVRLPAEEYDLEATVERVGAGLQRGEAAVLLQGVTDVETAERISEGDVLEAAGHTTATVESVTAYGTSNPDRKRLFVGLSLTTLEYGERSRYGDVTLQRGSDVAIEADSYELSGTIERVGATEQRGAPATRTVTLRMNEVPEEMADAIRPGLVERSAGETVARVTGVDAEPSVVLIRGEEGDLGVYDHPTDRDVTITAELDVRETTVGVRFKGESIRQGSRITLDLGTITVDATVVSIDG